VATSFLIMAIALTLPIAETKSPAHVTDLMPRVDATSAQFLTALGQRRLDGLLEEYCRQQMVPADDTPVSPAVAVSLAYSLSRRAAETAALAPREQLWQAADDVLAKAVNDTSDFLIRAQLTLEWGSLALAKGEWLRQWDELQGQIDQAPSAVKTLEEASRQLKQLLDALELSAVGDKSNSRASHERESIEELKELQLLTSFQLGSAELALAKSLPASADARAQELQSAVGHLRAVTVSPSRTELTLNATLKLSEALRIKGIPEQAWPLFVTLDLNSMTPADRDRVLVERVELLLAENRIIDAIEVVHEERRRKDHVPPEWEYLYLKVLLRQAAKMPSDPGAVGKLQASALRQLRLLDSASDPIWLRRGEVLLAQHAKHLLLRESTEYRQAAEILTRSGNHAQAAKVYAKAAEQSLGKGDDENALALLEESARSLEKGAEYAKARDTFEAIAHQWPDSAAAPEALLRAAINARRAYLIDHQPASYSELHQLVKNHLNKYPTDETSGDIHYLLGTMKKAERNYADAAHEFLTVPASHRLYSSSRLAASRVYELWKRPLAPDASSDGTLGQVIAYHESLVSPLTPNPPPFDVVAKAEITIRLARFLLDPRVDRAADAERWLESLLLIPGVPHEWVQEVRRFQILALCRQDRFHDAEYLATNHSRSNLDEVLATLQLLNDEASTVTELERKHIGQLQRVLAKDSLEQVKTLPDSRRLDWQLALAQIELNLANEPEIYRTIDQLQQLKRKHPRDARILEVLGLCYLQTERYQSAGMIWRELIAGAEEGSPLWFRAKLNLVTSLRRAGQEKQAREVLQLVELLHPELGGLPLRKRFQNEHQNLVANHSD
jgi:hypothetical protein